MFVLNPLMEERSTNSYDAVNREPSFCIFSADYEMRTSPERSFTKGLSSFSEGICLFMKTIVLCIIAPSAHGSYLM